ncbi:MAG: class I adenylate-forming enzyme family protein [Planctomycetota bacterium]|nr:class I adenylate-forming enzyme family protein [Planctomycetota bacterium]
MTPHRLLHDAASHLPEKPALVEAGRTLNYRQLLGAAEGFARHLRQIGLANCVVAIQMRNCIEVPVALLALDRVGSTALMLDPSLKGPETIRYCQMAKAAVRICSSDSTETGPSGTPVLPMPPLKELCASAASGGRDVVAAPASDDGIAVLLLSSGTQGPPKIVPKTSSQAGAAVGIFLRTLPYLENDHVLAVLPFFHSFGLFNVLLAGLTAGATLHIQPFSPREVVALVAAEGISALPATPFMFRMLAETEFRDPPDFSSIRLAMSAGSSLPTTILDRVRQKLGIGIAQSYGTTETGPISVTDPRVQAPVAGWVGKLYASVRVEIRNCDGNPSGMKQEGQIAVCSPAGATGYLGHGGEGDGPFRGQWILTGDIGRLDETGLYVLGRSRRIINIAGKKVSPAEVENCLLSHPAVADVLVASHRSPEGNDRVHATVVRRGDVGAVELQEYCARNLADFKVPRQIIFVQSLSRGAMDKVTEPNTSGTKG